MRMIHIVIYIRAFRIWLERIKATAAAISCLIMDLYTSVLFKPLVYNVLPAGRHTAFTLSIITRVIHSYYFSYGNSTIILKLSNKAGKDVLNT
jgi:hypothetical protein